MRLYSTLLLLVFPACALAQTEQELFDLTRLNSAFNERRRGAPEVDANKVINESNSFLKEKEPEMTSEEYALYEKAVTLLTSNPAFAVRLLEAMIKGDADPSPAFEFILGNAYYAANDVAKCEESYRKAVDAFPTFLRAWNNLGVLYYTTSRWPEAVKAFSRAVSLGDRNSTTYGLLAYSLEQAGNDNAAEVAYMQALSGDPSNIDWLEGLLRMCLKGHQVIRAESIARTLVKAHPRESRYWLILANVLLTAERRLDAAIVLETASGAGVANQEELVLLGDIYAESGMHNEALAIYTKLLTPAPSLGENRLLRFAESLAAAGRADEAAAALKALPAGLSAKGQSSRRLIAARIDAAGGREAEARAALEALLEDEPMNGDALLALGRIHVAAGDDARAGYVLETATQVPEAAYRANLELANLELRQRRYSRSVTHLEAALKIERSDAVADYLARIRTLAGEGEQKGQ